MKRCFHTISRSVYVSENPSIIIHDTDDELDNERLDSEEQVIESDSGTQAPVIIIDDDEREGGIRTEFHREVEQTLDDRLQTATNKDCEHQSIHCDRHSPITPIRIYRNRHNTGNVDESSETVEKDDDLMEQVWAKKSRLESIGPLFHGTEYRSTEDLTEPAIPVALVLNGHNSTILYASITPEESTGFTRGSLVWGRLVSIQWWPAMIVSSFDCGRATKKSDHLLVFWFGDHKISELPKDRVVPFVQDFPLKFSEVKSRSYNRAVIEAVMEHRCRIVPDTVEDISEDKELLDWASAGFISSYEPITGLPSFSKWIDHKLRCLREKYRIEEVEVVNDVAAKKVSATQRPIKSSCSYNKLKLFAYVKLHAISDEDIMNSNNECNKETYSNERKNIQDGSSNNGNRSDSTATTSDYGSVASADSISINDSDSDKDEEAPEIRCLVCESMSKNLSDHPFFEGRVCFPCLIRKFVQCKQHVSDHFPRQGLSIRDLSKAYSFSVKIALTSYGRRSPCQVCPNIRGGDWPKNNRIAIFSQSVGPVPQFLQGILKQTSMLNDDHYRSFYIMYCVVCGAWGKLLVCSNLGCNKVYCISCVTRYEGVDAPRFIEESSYWSCYLCSSFENAFNDIRENNGSGSGLLLGRRDWMERLERCAQPRLLPHLFPMTRGIRVLSLFDGIGSGLVALKSLGIQIDAYYASEIDADAICVTKEHHHEVLTHIGCVTKITRFSLDTLGPIDLVLGGSPCNDFSFVNPRRRGLQGESGKLFYEFVRVLNAAILSNRGQRVLFLHENIVKMDSAVQRAISKFLSCHPVRIDSADFSGMKRARHFWGNVPDMYRPHQYRGCIPAANTLKDVLSPYRTATVTKVRTITTNGDSLKRGDVLDDQDQPDTLRVPEIERLFGFPPHYTDVDDMGISNRRKLLGRAWSVPVIKHILSPLRRIFPTLSSD